MQNKVPQKAPKCKICKSQLERVKRGPLMKLIPASKHYRCPACEARFFECLGILQRC